MKVANRSSCLLAQIKGREDAVCPRCRPGAGASGPLAECFGESCVEGRLCEAVPLFSHVSHLTHGYYSYFSSAPPLCSATLASAPFLNLTPAQGLCMADPSARRSSPRFPGGSFPHLLQDFN